jgi:NOL1/NOP2/sun family putative RNA methylase
MLQHTLVPIRMQEMPEFKDKFVERYSALTNWDTFKEYSLSYLNRSLRVNTLKISIEDLKVRLEVKGWILEQVPWCKEAFWVEHVTGRRDLGNTMEHQLGYFYIQEAASMIPPIVLDPKEGELVLDMCASPGSKTTQMAQMMNNKGLILANDVSGMRLAPLGTNVQRLGCSCIMQTQHDGLRIPEAFNGTFDKVLLDAPCSGSGTIRKSIKTIKMWNPNALVKIAKLQMRLLEKAWKLLKPGGSLVYSTCSTDPEENEMVLTEFVNNHPDATIVDIELPGFKRADTVTSFNGVEMHPDVVKTLRVWPQDNDTEGFYVSKLVKSE